LEMLRFWGCSLPKKEEKAGKCESIRKIV